jgi:hypothetical protein
MKFYDDYTKFWTICCVIGLGVAAYMAMFDTRLLDAIGAHTGRSNDMQKVVLLGVALAASAIAAVVVYALAKISGVSIRDKKAD